MNTVQSTAERIAQTLSTEGPHYDRPWLALNDAENMRAFRDTQALQFLVAMAIVSVLMSCGLVIAAHLI